MCGGFACRFSAHVFAVLGTVASLKQVHDGILEQLERVANSSRENPNVQGAPLRLPTQAGGLKMPYRLRSLGRSDLIASGSAARNFKSLATAAQHGRSPSSEHESHNHPLRLK
jgi:hypothetical protein